MTRPSISTITPPISDGSTAQDSCTAQPLTRDSLCVSAAISLSSSGTALVTLGGSLTVVLKNGYRDYVSRRQLKAVKERMGLR